MRYFKPATVIELGTSLGISGAYLAAALPGTQVYTLEGAPAIAARAAENFQSLGLPNISVIPGRFDDSLPGLLATTGKADMVYIDGNHQYQPTMDYFRFFRDHRQNDTVLIFDDIHWSEGMEKAWEAIRNDETVTCSIDLFFLGYVFFRRENKTPVHFSIRY
ncbi:MAG: class I SAM-dependent methyltransferase [Flavihumibacter sp.]